MFSEYMRTDFKTRFIPVTLKETVRAEPVEACSRQLRDAQSSGFVSICAALPFDKLRTNGSL